MTALSVVGSVLSGVAQQALGNGVGFSLNAFLAAQSDGFAFDFTKTDRFFQENTGSTLADDVGESIGLALSSRLWNGRTLAEELAQQTNLINAASWTDYDSGTGDSTVVAGDITVTGTDGSNRGQRSQPITTVVGNTYELTFSGSIVSGTIGWRLGTTPLGTEIGSVAATAGINTIKFVATSTTTHVSFVSFTGGGSGSFTGISLKLIPGKHATQATGSLKPTRQTDGCKFDGSDDNLLTTYTAGSGENFIVALVTVPASISAYQVVAGLSGAGTDRFFIGLDTGGRLACGVGTDSISTILGSTDWRGQTVAVGLTCSGSLVTAFGGAAVEYSGAQAGAPSTSIPLRLGANNASGSALQFFGGSIKKIVAGREHLTLERYLQIRNALINQ